MLLALYHDKPSSAQAADSFQNETVLAKLKALDSRARRKGLESLDPDRNRLTKLGMEVNGNNQVTKNSFGVFSLSWDLEHHPEWPSLIREELAGIRKRIKDAHGATIKSLIWAGMGGSAEDKSMYNAVGLLNRGPRCYVLDSTDPSKLKAILKIIEARSRLPLPEALKGTLVVGMAMGMTSYEPVVNLQKLALLFQKYGVDSRPNFVYMTLPDSLLDQFGRKLGYHKVELQPDGRNGTAGRHSAPLTRGSLYPLGLSSVDLGDWMDAACLSQDEIHTAWRLAAFLHTQAKAGRDKVTLLLPKQWAGAGLWTKQNFEESLGKSESFGIKIVIDERPKMANYRGPKDPDQDRCFLAITIRGSAHQDAVKIKALRLRYPLASVQLAKPELSRYMQFIHYAVFGLAYLEDMNFVTQPSVELYKAITGRLHAEAENAGGIERTSAWQEAIKPPDRSRPPRNVSVHFNLLPENLRPGTGSAAAQYASVLKSLAGDRRIEYGELTFFGDMRYSAEGKRVRKALERAAEGVFRARLNMPVDVYEGPAMNHSYHEMIIGHGRCLSTVLLSEKPEKLAAADYTAEYHRAQFLATQLALAERGRFVVAITLKDLEADSLAALGKFFDEVALELRSKRPRRGNKS